MPDLTDEILTRLSPWPIPLSAFVADIPRLESERHALGIMTRLGNRHGFAVQVQDGDSGRTVHVHRDNWPAVKRLAQQAWARLELARKVGV